MNKDKMVRITEIWMPVKEGGEAICWQNNKRYKRIALLADGYPLELKKGYLLEDHHITEEEYKSFHKKPNQ